jgi:O-antigen/teichoic acid export membrane protein
MAESLRVDKPGDDSSEGERSLTERAISGAAWSGAGRVAVQVVSLCGTMALARLLTPQAFGLVGMARLATGLIDIFRDLGTASAIIQRSQLTEKLLSSIFWANVLLGVSAALATITVAPIVALFFHEPETVPIIRALAAGFILSALGAVHAALLSRKMAFRRIAVVEILAAISTTLIAIGMALKGAGVWSLVISLLVGTAASTTLFWLTYPWRPKWVISWHEIRSISSYSLNLSGFSVVNYFSRNADNAIVGRYLGAFQLGFYQLAYNVMLYAIQNVSAVLGRVLFPAFVKVKDDNARFRQAYTKGVSMIAVITFPAMGGLMAVAVPFVRAVLGTKWLPVASLLTILAPVGLMQSIITTTGNIYSAKGRTDWLFRWGVFATIIFVGSFCAGIPWGIKGVAVAYLLANLVLVYPVFSIPFKLIDLKMRDFLRPLWPILFFSATMSLVVRGLAFVLRSRTPATQLAFLVPTGTLIYCSLLALARPIAAVNLLGVVTVPMKRRRARAASLSEM